MQLNISTIYKSRVGGTARSNTDAPVQIGKTNFFLNNDLFENLQSILDLANVRPHEYSQIILALSLYRYTNQEQFIINYLNSRYSLCSINYNFSTGKTISDLILHYVESVKTAITNGFDEYLISKELDSNILFVSDLELNIKQYKSFFQRNIQLLLEKNVLIFEQNFDNYNVSVYYNKDLIDEELLYHFIESYKTLYQAISRDMLNSKASYDINKYEMLSDEQSKNIIYNWNNKKGYPNNKPLHLLFEEQASKFPSNIAIKFQDKELTYSQLNQQANQLTHYLMKSFDLKVNDLVMICLDRSENLLVSILAILKAGCAYLPVDPIYPDDRISFILNDSQPKVIVTSFLHHLRINAFLDKDRYESNLPPLLLSIDNSEIEELISSQPILNPPIQIKSNDLAYIIYTSGTTGKPKGVLQTHGNVMRLFTATEEWFNFNTKDVWILFHSYVFDFSVWEMWGAFIYGGTLVVPSYEQVRDLNQFYDLCYKSKVTVLNQTPTVFYQFIEIATSRKNKILNSLRYIIFGGEVLNLTQLNPWFNHHGYDIPRLINMYGITETTVHVTYKPINKDDLGANSYIGHLIPDLTGYVLDKNLYPLPIGAVGELYVGGAGLAIGYLNRPELSEARFIPNKFQSQFDKELNKNHTLYKTGDLVRWLPDGSLEYIGRNDSQIKIRGYRIELGEIESVLLNYKGMRQCAVVSNKVEQVVDNSGNLQYLVGYYVSDEEIDNNDLIRYLEQRLPEYMVPNIFMRLPLLPRTVNGKLDKQALPAPLVTNTTNYVKPRNDLEVAIVKIWAKALRVNSQFIGIQDDFFRLGGNSILAIKVVNFMRTALKLDISVIDILQLKTIEQLVTVSSSNRIRGLNLNFKKSLQTVNLSESLILQHYCTSNAKNMYNESFVVELEDIVSFEVFSSSINELIQS